MNNIYSKVNNSFERNDNMTTKVKIKINDNPELRFQLDIIYQSKSQVEMARWAI